MVATSRLDDAARKMIAAAECGRSVVAALRRSCPHIYDQIRRDRRCPKVLSLWGRSVNIDENVGAVIVHPAIIGAIAEVAGVPIRGPSVPAGLHHTYGYLFSLLDTPYGRKRKRWVTPDLERGFGIDVTLLSDRPRSGTLLGNVTYFLGRIVYRHRTRELRLLERHGHGAAPELRGYDYSGLIVWRNDERAAVGKHRRPILLRTEVVHYPNKPRSLGAETALLIYSVQHGASGRLKLITAFPITAVAFEDIAKRAAAPVGPIRPRYNAYVPELRHLSP